MASSEGRRSYSLTLQIVGPMVRTTFGPEPVDLSRERLNDVFHWANATRLQIRRLLLSLSQDFPYALPRRRVQQRRRASITSYDAHMTLVAAANLDKALNRLPKKWRLDIDLMPEHRRALRLLRDIHEHWDQLRQAYRSGKPLRDAARKLSEEFPTAEPWSMTIDPNGPEVIIAGTVPLRALAKQIRSLEARILRMERRLSSPRSR